MLGYLYRAFWLYPRISRVLQGRLIDVGCGIGDMLKFRPDTVGVDINPHVVNWGRRLGRNVHLVVNCKRPFDQN